MTLHTSQNKDVWGGLGRARLQCKYSPLRRWLFEAQTDIELIPGSIVDTPDFQFLKERRRNTFMDLDKEILDNPDAYAEVSIYRSALRYQGRPVKFTLGRQRVAWGVGRLWNPIDLFNPTSPLQIEAGEKVGVDALLVECALGSLSTLSGIYAPGDRCGESSYAFRYRTTVGEYDLQGMLGEFRDDVVLGLSFDGYLLDAGLRGEFTYTWGDGEPSDSRGDYWRLVVGADYNIGIGAGLYLVGELFHNGGALKRSLQGSQLFGVGAEIVTRYENFLGLGAGYDLTPLCRLDGTVIVDLDRGSLLVGPSLSYSMGDNLTVAGSAQLFTGCEPSEFGDLPHVFFVECEWFF